MIFKNTVMKFRKFIKIMRNPDDRKNFLLSKLTLKNFIIYGLLTNVVSTIILIPIFNDSYINLSISRLVSRMVGRIGDFHIPLFMRNNVFSSYIRFYKVNQDEILDPELQNYNTIKDFFIRKIKLEKRPIENPSDEILSSPCDGRIFSFSEIHNFDEIFFVKKTKDSLTKFLFGDFHKNHPNWRLELLNPEKRYYQMTIYLSPGDCHRYYSPSNMNVSERIYIPGFLEPVKPSYVLKHPKVFSMNERVTLKCNYKNSGKKDDILYMTFVGALNVGSINLSFDDYLKTNDKTNVPDMNDESNFILKYSEILQKNYNFIKENEKIYYKPKVDEFEQSLLKEFEEFDVRDTIDLDMDVIEKYKINVDNIQGKTKDYIENAVVEITKRRAEMLKFNIYNNFLSEDIISYKIRKNLKNPKKLKIEDFKVSDNGVEFSKKDELGWFNFGSTIVLVFSVDKEKEIVSKFMKGEQVKIGQSLIEIKN